MVSNQIVDFFISFVVYFGLVKPANRVEFYISFIELTIN